MKLSRKHWKIVAGIGWLIAMVPIGSGMLGGALFPSFSPQSNLVLMLGSAIFATAVVKGDLMKSGKSDE
jgi:hypothetical protein